VSAKAGADSTGAPSTSIVEMPRVTPFRTIPAGALGQARFDA